MDISANSEQTSKQEAISEKDAKRNFFLAYINGVFASIGFRFIDSSMVLPAFIKQLTKSNILVGLTSSTMVAGSIWLQLFMSNMMEHRPRKMPFYTFGIVVRLTTWVLIILSTSLIGNSNQVLLFAIFYFLYFTFCSSLGISNLPFNDIVAKAIPANRIARLFGTRQFTGEAFGIGVGVLIRFILGERCSLAFPYNYAVIFALGFIGLVISGVSFIWVKEPIEPVHKERQTFREHLKLGPHFLKTDKNYMAFLKFRIFASFGAMSIPFYIPYALDRMKIHASTIGTFTAVGAISALLFNAIWSYIGEKQGSRRLMVVSYSIACIVPMIAVCTRFLPQHLQVTFYLLVFVANQAYTSGSNIAYMTYTLNMAPKMNRPTYLGFMNTLMFPLGFVPVIAGALLRIIPYEYMFSLSAVFSVFGIYFATRLADVENRINNIKTTNHYNI
jgi:MFS family permease